jgi:ubiquinone biosynthesis protein Coq4
VTDDEIAKLLVLCEGLKLPLRTGTGEHWSRDVRNAEGDSLAWCGDVVNGQTTAQHIVSVINSMPDVLRALKEKP